MKKMLFALSLVAMMVAQCAQEDKKPLLIGRWQGTSWTVNDKDSGRDASAVTFEFKADDTYTGSFGDNTESGSYRISSGKLYTTAENQIEKTVKIAKLDATNLVFDMNRAGTAEMLTLVKQ